eukprot:Mrub_00570.p1 GENE.Mrub_00570~~Mrub_00570.p1  ORF type:complete len:994 (-),score=156.45 Mrub_00570:49-2940(-)
MNHEKCLDSCLSQGDGNYYCNWQSGRKKLVMLCFPPYNDEFISEYYRLLKIKFVNVLNNWLYRVDSESRRYNQFDNMYNSSALIHTNLQGKLSILDEMRRKSTSMVQDMLDYRTKFIKIDAEIKGIKDWIKLYYQKQISGKSTGVTTDCTGIYGYKGEAAGDGLYVQYFKNEVFKGDAINDVDYSVDHVWPTISPHPDLNKNNFSVRWYGYLVVPKSGSYTLVLDSDCGGVVKINGDIVIKDRIVTGDVLEEITDWNKYKNKALMQALKNKQFYNVASGDIEWETNNKSEAIEMFKGQFYDIEVFYPHTVHDSYLGLNTAYVRLKWESMDLPLQVIPGFYYYKSIVEPVDFIFEYDKSIIELDSLFDNKDAFMDSKEWRIADIPVNLSGIVWLKSLRYFYFKYIQFKSVVNVTIYIAIDWTESYPLENGWQRSDLEMSMLQVDSDVYDDLMNKGSAVSSDQIDFAVYRRDFFKGDIKIKFNIGDGDYRNLMIFAVPNLLMKNYTCGGSEKNLSDSSDDSSRYAGCEASSALDNSYNCKKGLGGGQWKTENEGVGSFIIVRFTDVVFPTHLEIQNGDNYADMNKLVRIYYNDARYYDITLRQTKELQSIPVKNATYTDYVKIEVMQVYGTNNNGFGLKVFGLLCQDEAEIKMRNQVELERFTDNTKIILKCQNTISNTIGINTKVGSKTMVYCEESCKTYVYNRIYGKDKVYSSDTHICRAAYYEEIIGEDGGFVVIEFGKGKEKFEAGREKFGITPEPRLENDSASLILSKPMTASAESKSGWIENEIVDVKNDVKCWIRGKITSMTASNGKNMVDIEAEGLVYSFQLPSDEWSLNVSKCGSKLRGEGCEGNQNIADYEAASPLAQQTEDKYAKPKIGLDLNSWEGGDCLTNPLDCIFDNVELIDNSIPCENELMMIKIRGSQYKRLNCMTKCILKQFETEGDCTKTCPGECGIDDGKYVCKL